VTGAAALHVPFATPCQPGMSARALISALV